MREMMFFIAVVVFFCYKANEGVQQAVALMLDNQATQFEYAETIEARMGIPVSISPDGFLRSAAYDQHQQKRIDELTLQANKACSAAYDYWIGEVLQADHGHALVEPFLTEQLQQAMVYCD